MDHAGVRLPDVTISGVEPTHVFAIGDWGGLDGTLWTGQMPPNGRARLITYEGGHLGGPHVFPRSRWNLHHTERLCDHKQFVECFNTKGAEPCEEGCGYIDGLDSEPQLLVAEQFKARAALMRPKYILNVGDNFYWGGIEVDCGSSAMSVISPEARHQFDQIFEGVYYGDGLDGIPWFSVLGNHDWGGRVFNNGWDQQIAYTWSSARWIMPAPYFMQRVNYVDQGFSIDYIFIDSNAMDAQDPSEDPEHNLCSEKYNTLQGNNKQNATCGDIGGPDDIYTCKEWFWNFWDTNKKWAEEKLIASREEGIQWQIMITHFPCGHESEWYGRMRREHGLDLLVTGHRHDQELWLQGHWGYNMLSGLTCFVTGGGGGITSEATPEENDGNWYGEAQYGFYDMTIEKDKITIDSIDYKGEVILTGEVRPCDAWCPL